jgi:hypothetical protein
MMARRASGYSELRDRALGLGARVVVARAAASLPALLAPRDFSTRLHYRFDTIRLSVKIINFECEPLSFL